MPCYATAPPIYSTLLIFAALYVVMMRAARFFATARHALRYVKAQRRLASRHGACHRAYDVTTDSYQH